VISFEPTEEQAIAREVMAEFARETLRPAARECDEASTLPEPLLDAVWELGLVSTSIPAAYGGGDEERSPLTQTLILEELAYGDVALAAAALAPALFAFPVVEFGSEAQKRELLPLFCTDRYHPASIAWIEAGPAFDPFALQTKAEPKGSGYVLSGAKTCVPLADRSSHFLVLARNGHGGGFGGAEAFIVPRDAAGLSISATEPKLGLRALPTARLDLDRVELPGEARLGGEAGCDPKRLLNLSRTALAAAMTGLSRAVMDYALPYAKDREAFGEAIAKKQAIAFRLADMRIETEAMRWVTWKAASRLERGLDATREAQLARSYAARQCMTIADHGVQTLGGHGFIREHPVEMWYRNARTLGVLEGTLCV